MVNFRHSVSNFRPLYSYFLTLLMIKIKVFLFVKAVTARLKVHSALTHKDWVRFQVSVC